jgi:hypothetical protein
VGNLGHRLNAEGLNAALSDCVNSHKITSNTRLRSMLLVYAARALHGWLAASPEILSNPITAPLEDRASLIGTLFTRLVGCITLLMRTVLRLDSQGYSLVT